MLSFIFEQSILFFTFAAMLFVPGFVLLMAIFGRHGRLYLLEKTVLSLGLSMGILDFAMLSMGRSGIPLNRISVIGSLLAITTVSYAIYRKRFGKKPESLTDACPRFTLSKHQLYAALLLIASTLFIKTVYLSGTALPTSTDAAHHIYWSKLIASTGKIPVYEETDIDIATSGLVTEKIADFIVGEHLPIAALGIVSGNDFTSAFPVLFLFLVNLASIAAVVMFSLRLFEKSGDFKTVALLTLFFIGPLYALSSPQAKFVSGGVIGNTLGNFLIPLILYCVVLALREKSRPFLLIAAFTSFTLAFTHHLSTFILIFISLFSAAVFVIVNIRDLSAQTKDIFRLLLHPHVAAMIAICLLFMAAIYTPTYLNASAVDTAVGTPTKSTRTGLTLEQLASTTGESRLALGAAGIFLLLLSHRRKQLGSAILVGWALALSVMSLHPDWLFVDIPSNRIASYIIFPFSIAAAYGLYTTFELIKKSSRDCSRARPALAATSFFLLGLIFLQSGSFDNARFATNNSDAEKAVQTYGAADYLARNTTQNDIILKDHNYIAADSWIKLSFMRGYTYPLSRGYFKRYEDATKPREMCTYAMIATPAETDAIECFEKTGTAFMMVNPRYDSAQFKKNRDFSQVYSAEDIAIFRRQTE